jgi:hypothetical protein
MVSNEFAAPAPGVTEGGVKITVAPDGCPEAVRVTASLNTDPAVPLTVTTTEALPPVGDTSCSRGAAAIVKSAVVGPRFVPVCTALL